MPKFVIPNNKNDSTNNMKSNKKDGDPPLKQLKKAWTTEEDNILMLSYQHHLGQNWHLIALALPHRTGKQCRERYHNHLQEGVKKGDWSHEEDKLIMDMHSIYGNQWAKIARLLPNRSDNAVKNRWRAVARRKKWSRLPIQAPSSDTSSSMSDSDQPWAPLLLAPQGNIPVNMRPALHLSDQNAPEELHFTDYENTSNNTEMSVHFRNTTADSSSTIPYGTHEHAECDFQPYVSIMTHGDLAKFHSPTALMLLRNPYYVEETYNDHPQSSTTTHHRTTTEQSILMASTDRVYWFNGTNSSETEFVQSLLQRNSFLYPRTDYMNEFPISENYYPDTINTSVSFSLDHNATCEPL